MSNMTMCMQQDCPLSNNCLRFRAERSEFMKLTYFFNYDPREPDGYCPFYKAPNQLNLSFE